MEDETVGSVGDELELEDTVRSVGEDSEDGMGSFEEWDTVGSRGEDIDIRWEGGSENRWEREWEEEEDADIEWLKVEELGIVWEKEENDWFQMCFGIWTYTLSSSSATTSPRYLEAIAGNNNWERNRSIFSYFTIRLYSISSHPFKTK